MALVLTAVACAFAAPILTSVDSDPCDGNHTWSAAGLSLGLLARLLVAVLVSHSVIELRPTGSSILVGAVVGLVVGGIVCILELAVWAQQTLCFSF